MFNLATSRYATGLEVHMLDQNLIAMQYYVTLMVSRFQVSPLFALFFCHRYLLNRSCYASRTKTNWLRNLPSMQLVGLQPHDTTNWQVMELLMLPILVELWRVAAWSATDQRSRTLFPATNQDSFRQKVSHIYWYDMKMSTAWYRDLKGCEVCTLWSESSGALSNKLWQFMRF